MRFPFKKRLLLIGLLSFALLGLGGCKSGEKIIADLIVKAEKGDVNAMLKLGETYCAARVIEQDEQSCGIWIRQAAEKGHRHAQYLLGNMLEKGVGMREDPVMAYAWYSVSSSQAHKMARSSAAKLKARMNPLQVEFAERRASELIAQFKNAPERT